MLVFFLNLAAVIALIGFWFIYDFIRCTLDLRRLKAVAIQPIGQAPSGPVVAIQGKAKAIDAEILNFSGKKCAYLRCVVMKVLRNAPLKGWTYEPSPAFSLEDGTGTIEIWPGRSTNQLSVHSLKLTDLKSTEAGLEFLSKVENEGGNQLTSKDFLHVYQILENSPCYAQGKIARDPKSHENTGGFRRKMKSGFFNRIVLLNQRKAEVVHEDLPNLRIAFLLLGVLLSSIGVAWLLHLFRIA